MYPDMIIGIIAIIANFVVASTAVYQIWYIKNRNKPQLILQRISKSNFIIRNIGSGIAYNFKIEILGKTKYRASVLNPTEFLKFTIPTDELTSVLLNRDSNVLVFIVKYSSQFQTNLQENFTLNLGQKNIYELNLDPEIPMDKPKDDFQFKLI